MGFLDNALNKAKEKATSKAKNLFMKPVMDKAQELYDKGNTVDMIAKKFWENDSVTTELDAMNINMEELVKMIKNKVGEK